LFVARSKVKNYIKLDPRLSRLGLQLIRWFHALALIQWSFLGGVEPISMSRFSKFVNVEIPLGEAYLKKGTIVYKVWPKVFEGGDICYSIFFFTFAATLEEKTLQMHDKCSRR
jgi:hypothetical protein